MKNIKQALESFLSALMTREFNSDDLPSETQDTDARIRRLGYGLLVFLFGGFILLASTAPLESAARAPGKVEVEGKRKTLQHFEGGIVAEILVSDGDFVSVGQALMVLDTKRSLAELRRLEGRLWATQALIDRLTSERDDEASVKFSEDLAMAADSRAVSAIENEQIMFRARRAERLGELDLALQKRAQFEEQLAGLSEVISSKREVAISMEDELDDLSILLDEGYVDKQRIRQLTRTLSETLGEISELETRASIAKVSLRETDLQTLQLEKRFKTQVTDALTIARDELFDLLQLQSVISDRVERAKIVAPVAGVVLDVQPNVIGAVISPGGELLSIVPDTEELIVSARVSPLDIDRIQVGQAVEMRFSVFKGSYMISGELTKVSADSLIDPLTGAPYYSAKIKLSSEDVALLDGKDLVPGMPVEVLIKTGTRTLMGYLTSPIQRAFPNALIEE